MPRPGRGKGERMKAVYFVSMAFNAIIVVVVLRFVLDDPPGTDDIKSWAMIALAVGSPLLNLFALSTRPGILRSFAALTANTAVLGLFGLTIFLMLVWPLGSKPRGTDLFCMLSAYAAVLVTEGALVSKARRAVAACSACSEHSGPKSR